MSARDFRVFVPLYGVCVKLNKEKSEQLQSTAQCTVTQGGLGVC
jgi:hypothetical protein